MTSIKYPSGVSNYFHYDSMLRRYAMEDSDGLRYFSWDYSGLKLLTERDEQGEVTALYSHGYSAIPGIGSVATAQKFESDTTYYQFPSYDNRGSVYRLTDDDGDVVFSAEYNAFGEVLDESNTGATNRLGYSTNWISLKDSGNELVLSPARVYSAKLGRFLQKDFLLQMTLLNRKGSYWNSIFRGRSRSVFRVDNYGLYRALKNCPYKHADSFGQESRTLIVNVGYQNFTLYGMNNPFSSVKIDVLALLGDNITQGSGLNHKGVESSSANFLEFSFGDLVFAAEQKANAYFEKFKGNELNKLFRGEYQENTVGFDTSKDAKDYQEYLALQTIVNYYRYLSSFFRFDVGGPLMIRNINIRLYNIDTFLFLKDKSNRHGFYSPGGSVFLSKNSDELFHELAHVLQDRSSPMLNGADGSERKHYCITEKDMNTITANEIVKNIPNEEIAEIVRIGFFVLQGTGVYDPPNTFTPDDQRNNLMIETIIALRNKFWDNGF